MRFEKGVGGREGGGVGECSKRLMCLGVWDDWEVLVGKIEKTSKK